MTSKIPISGWTILEIRFQFFCYLDPKVQPTEKNVTCEYATTKFCYKFVTDTKTPKVYR